MTSRVRTPGILARLNPATKTWDRVINNGTNGEWACGGPVDVVRDRLVLSIGYNQDRNKFTVYQNLSSGIALTYKTLVDAGGLAKMLSDTSWGQICHAYIPGVIDKYLWLGNQLKILAIDAVTWNISVFCDVGAQVSPAGPHCYGNFEFFPKLGGCVLYRCGWRTPFEFTPLV
jgi:hypothetical protein